MKKVNTNKAYQLRLLFVFIVVELLFVVCIIRAFQLQILSGSDLRKMATRQHFGTIRLSPDRGIIFDRNGNQLAVSTMTLSLYAHPTKVPKKKKTARTIAKILRSPRQSYYKLRRIFYKKLRQKSSFVWLARQQEPRKVEKIEKLKIRGLGSIPEPKRFYPCRSLAAQCIGYCNIDGIGLDGIELKYNKYLRGKPVRLLVARDAKGNPIIMRKQEAFATSKVHHVYLTLDETIQHIVEEELARAVVKHRAKSGMAIVMNPNTGEVLAMANYPFFNPNRRPERGTSLNRRRNRTVTDLFEPGSMFKPFLVAAALESKKYKGTETIYCENGHFKIGRYTIHDVHPHKYLKLSEVIKFSSNIGAAKIGTHLGKNIVYTTYRKFGFGQKTGIGLPGESPGVMQPLKSLPPISLATMSFGQGIAVTALQIVTAVSAIANGGTLMKPYIVKKIVDAQGMPLLVHQPVRVRKVISPQTAHLLTSFMVGVTSEGGTATRAAIEGFQVAGKTGTSQKPRTDGKRGYDPTKFIGSFVGFVPAEDPRITILVVIDEPKGIPYGGVVAAPAFKAMATRILRYMNVAPKVQEIPLVAISHPFSTPGIVMTGKPDKAHHGKIVNAPKAQKTSSSEKILLPDFSGMSMRSVIRWGARHGVNLTLKGNGQAIRQSPKPGTPVSPGGRCSVWFTFPS
ncbi:MAG: transpeptidase family protein [Deltaproteobacteria bacterium]|nr:transpeptidase family protein [Deltaproteobacteria bacterium]